MEIEDHTLQPELPAVATFGAEVRIEMLHMFTGMVMQGYVAAGRHPQHFGDKEAAACVAAADAQLRALERHHSLMLSKVQGNG